LGGNDTKKNYIQELTKFITQNNPPLCADCQRRYQTNPLRILDCLTCQEISFPTYKMVWDNQSQNYVQELNHLLDQFNFPYQYDYHLVRGLDYYTGLVFEVSLTNEKALLGGGRYDHLYQKIADRQVPALGFALGIERLLDYLQNYQPLKIDRGVDIFFLTSLNEFYFPILIWKKELTQHS
jgi:histidyl-tRNA synthetase